MSTELAPRDLSQCSSLLEALQSLNEVTCGNVWLIVGTNFVSLPSFPVPSWAIPALALSLDSSVTLSFCFLSCKEEDDTGYLSRSLPKLLNEATYVNHPQ